MKRLLAIITGGLFFFIAGQVIAATTWTTGGYSNNSNLRKTLSVPGASSLSVTVKGATEKNYDYVYIYDHNGTEVKSLTGSINETFTISGSSILANLVSDHSVTDKGVTITVRAVGGSSSKVTWTTGAYSDNAKLSKKLWISDAPCLSVTVKGATEKNYDYIYIYDHNGTKVKSLTGSINKTFTVSGYSIIAKLVSDHSVTDKGVTITVRKASNCTVRIDNVPFQSQLSASCKPNYLCGFACTNMLTSFLHDTTPTVKTMQDMAKYETEMSCPTILTKVDNYLSAAKARHLGNAPHSYWKWLTFDQIKRLVDTGIPVSVGVKYSEFNSKKFGDYRLDRVWNKGHRVVIVGYSPSRAIWIIHDPLGKNASIGAYREIPSSVFRAAMQQARFDAGGKGDKFDVLVVQ